MNTIPTVTKNLLIINVLMFLGTIVAQSYGFDLSGFKKSIGCICCIGNQGYESR